MKKSIFTTIIILSSLSTFAQIVDIPDENFKAALLDNFELIDTNGDGEIQTAEAAITTLIVASFDNITDITGIEAFTSLELLELSGNNIASVDLSQNAQLLSLSLNQNPITEIDVSFHPELEILRLNQTQIQEIDLSSNTNLKRLSMQSTPIENLDLSLNTSLEVLSLTNTSLTTLSVLELVALRDLSVNISEMTEIDVSNNVLLESLNLRGSGLTTIDLENNTNLIILDVSFTSLEAIDLSQNTQIGVLFIAGNPIESIDLSTLSELKGLDIGFTNLTTLDLSMNTQLFNVNAAQNNNLMTVNLQNGANELLALGGECEVIATDSSFGFDSGANFSQNNDTLISICVDNIAFAEENFLNVPPTTELIEDCSLSTEEINTPLLTVFPNPTTDHIHISQPMKSVSVYDLTGKRVYTGSDSSVSLKNLNNGVYIVRLETQEGAMMTKKIIKRS